MNSSISSKVSSYDVWWQMSLSEINTSGMRSQSFATNLVQTEWHPKFVWVIPVVLAPRHEPLQFKSVFIVHSQKPPSMSNVGVSGKKLQISATKATLVKSQGSVS